MQKTVEEIARDLGGVLEGNGEAVVKGVAGIQEALEGDITFVANARYAAHAASTKAVAVIVPDSWDRPCSAAIIKVERPDKAFTEVCSLFVNPPVEPEPGIHPTAVLSDDCKIGANVSIGACCVLEKGVEIGDDTVVFPGCTIGAHSIIGKACRLYARVSIREYVTIGDRVILQDGAVVGSDGFGYTVDEAGVRSKIRQAGTVEIGNDVEIGANTTIDRARFGKTRIGNGVKIDNLVQIAHNVTIGDHAVIVAQTGISGSTAIGARAILAGQSGVAGHLVIGDGAIVGGRAGVTKDVPAGTFVSWYPAMPHAQATRLQANIRRLPELREAVKNIAERLDRLERSQQDAVQ